MKGWKILQYFLAYPILPYIDFSTVESEMVTVTRIRKVMQKYKYSYFLDALSLSFILYFNCT